MHARLEAVVLGRATGVAPACAALRHINGSWSDTNAKRIVMRS
jgi:hypothetical protein